jgi:hypothetical protein
MEIQYYSKIRWGLAPLAPNDAPPLTIAMKRKTKVKFRIDAMLLFHVL